MILLLILFFLLTFTYKIFYICSSRPSHRLNFKIKEESPDTKGKHSG